MFVELYGTVVANWYCGIALTVSYTTTNQSSYFNVRASS